MTKCNDGKRAHFFVRGLRSEPLPSAGADWRMDIKST